MNAYIKQHTESTDNRYRQLMENYLKGKDEISSQGLAENYLEHYMQKRRGGHDKAFQRNFLAEYMDKILNLYD